MGKVSGELYRCDLKFPMEINITHKPGCPGDCAQVFVLHNLQRLKNVLRNMSKDRIICQDRRICQDRAMHVLYKVLFQRRDILLFD